MFVKHWRTIGKIIKNNLKRSLISIAGAVLMRKVFKHTGAKPDLFTTLAFYTHNQIIQCKTSSLKEIAGAYRAGRIMKFWRDNDIDTLIANNPLKKDSDVIALTNEIYDLFAKKFKDKSEKLDFSKVLNKEDITLDVSV